MGDDSAYEALERFRWDGHPLCPHCGADNPYFLTPKNGKTRITTRGTETVRRVWKCRKCRRQFSALTGTIFQGSKIPPDVLVSALSEGETGESIRAIAKKYGVSPRTAHKMLSRLGSMS